MDKKETALLELGRVLRACEYRFVTPTPETHRAVNRRDANGHGRSLTDIFGWSRPFGEAALPPELQRLLAEADALDSSGPLLRSMVRFSSLGDFLFVHSAFPTEASDAVFFGPDTYRFARAIQTELRPNGAAPSTIVDIGAGSGAGAFVAASLVSPQHVILTDINPKALRLAEVNAALNEISGVEYRQSDVLSGVAEYANLILCNPPYLVDATQRVYRHGGGSWGFDLSLRIVREGLEHLAPGGRLILYTGTPIVGGSDLFLAAVRPLLAGRAFRYAEIDPDVFAEELARPPYDTADRIAVVLLVVQASEQVNDHAA
jgi:SAM-dependent methyltransferase